MSDIKIFSNDEFRVYDYLLRNENAAKIIIDSLFGGELWYQALINSCIDVYIYCSDIPSLVERIKARNNAKPCFDDYSTIKLIMFSIDNTTGKVISIGSNVTFNHGNNCMKSSFSLSSTNETYTIESYKYNITLYELETFNEIVGESKMINRFTVPLGFIDTGSLSNDLGRYNGSLLCIKTLQFTPVSWFADTQYGESYDTLSLYICRK